MSTDNPTEIIAMQNKQINDLETKLNHFESRESSNIAFLNRDLLATRSEVKSLKSQNRDMLKTLKSTMSALDKSMELLVKVS